MRKIKAIAIDNKNDNKNNNYIHCIIDDKDDNDDDNNNNKDTRQWRSQQHLICISLRTSDGFLWKLSTFFKSAPLI